ncbi:MAG TPA: carboxymuconolactone decarboxylase family protein [Microbacterium sp.]|jgi:AhpD family alkylhydroperoxidase|nr:carboxymuconolactone decarboxylase family protein [Microbacterium sp.]
MTIDAPHDTGLRLDRAEPAVYKALLAVAKEADAAAVRTGLERRLIELIRVRASQLNGCAYCLRMHTRDAVTAGESTDRLAVLSAWRETGYFSPVERAALALTETVTLIADHQAGRAARIDDLSALTEQQHAAVRWLVIIINSFNRVAITSHYQVAPAPGAPRG